MSHHTATNGENNVIAYGFDSGPIPGYFVDLPNGTQLDTRAFLAQPPKASSRGDILKIMQEYGAPEEHCHAIGLDIPF